MYRDFIFAKLCYALFKYISILFETTLPQMKSSGLAKLIFRGRENIVGV